MNAVQAIETIQGIQVLKAPYRFWRPDEVLNYFKARTGIHYFAIADESQVKREKIDAILQNRFDFNEECFWFEQDVDWLNNASTDIEWAIMLHKFYYAVGLGLAFSDTGNSRYVKKWMELTESWIENVPSGFLSSDVTGRRVQNWIFAHYYFVTLCRAEAITPEFYARFLESVHEQVEYLCGHLTPARNHRTLELYTIFLAAVVFPEFESAARWLRFSMDELVKNMQADFLADGVHCELSTDYHHIVLRNFLAVKKLAVLNKIPLSSSIDEGIKRALEFSLYVHKPDGTIPSLSDGDTGNFQGLLAQGYEFYGCEYLRYAAAQGNEGAPPPFRSKAFKDGGYYILRSGWGEREEPYEDERYLVFDCGVLGQGNHGHLDLLSFEMAAYGRSLIVDPGRYTYDESGEVNWRVLFRSTRYHNTVVVDNKDQTRYEFHKKKFKILGPAPDFELKAFVTQPGFDYLHGVAASHEYPVIHERKILFVAGEYWLVCDLLRAEEKHRYDLLFHLSAAAFRRVQLACESGCFVVSSPNLLMMQPAANSVTACIEDGYVSFRYGQKQPAPIINFSHEGADYCFYTLLYPYKHFKPDIEITSSPMLDQQANHSLGIKQLQIHIDKQKLSYRDEITVFNQDKNPASSNAVSVRRTDDEGRLLAQFEWRSANW